MSVRVVTAEEAARRDAAAIAAGTGSRALMQRAGAAAADAILRHFGDDARDRGACVVTGPGNNGGDGWVVAGHLAGAGIAVRVHEVLPSRTGDAIAERTAAIARVTRGPPRPGDGVVVDALLGTGARGDAEGPVREAVSLVRECRAAGSRVVALDLPTGVDASSGAGSFTVVADLTISFGTVKRGHLLARDACGAIMVVDIGLGAHANLDDGAPILVDAAFVAGSLPRIGADSHKGVRRRVVIAGGARGMAGAVTLAARAAARSGAGMVRALVEEPSLLALQATAIEATVATWPIRDADLREAVSGYAHAVLVGPGLGRSDASRALLGQLLDAWRGPAVIDADALNLFAGDVNGLAAALDGRPALLTPHASELARLAGVEASDVVAARFDIGRDLARATRAAVLLKGVPTVVTAPDGSILVSAAGTPALAAAGSGDLLGGIAVTLLAQTGDPLRSGACAAWIHGRAAEIANAGRPVRGVTLTDVMEGLAWSWDLAATPPAPGVLAELPSVGDRPA